MSFEPSSPADLVAHLVAGHHAFLHENLDRLAHMVATVVDAHRQQHPEILAVAVVFDRFREDMELHLAHEESRVFPAIVALCEPCPTVSAPDSVLLKWLDGLEAEHQYQAADLDELRELTGGFQVREDTCWTYGCLLDGLSELERDTREHVRFEDEVLFPMVRALALPVAPTPSRGS